ASLASGALCFSQACKAAIQKWRPEPRALRAAPSPVMRHFHCFHCSRHCSPYCSFLCYPLFFPLLFIVLAPTAFLSLCQSLVLQTASIFHCRSIVLFWRGAAPSVFLRCSPAALA